MCLTLVKLLIRKPVPLSFTVIVPSSNSLSPPRVRGSHCFSARLRGSVVEEFSCADSREVWANDSGAAKIWLLYSRKCCTNPRFLYLHMSAYTGEINSVRSRSVWHIKAQLILKIISHTFNHDHAFFFHSRLDSTSLRSTDRYQCNSDKEICTVRYQFRALQHCRLISRLPVQVKGPLSSVIL